MEVGGSGIPRRPPAVFQGTRIIPSPISPFQPYDTDDPGQSHADLPAMVPTHDDIDNNDDDNNNDINNDDTILDALIDQLPPDVRVVFRATKGVIDPALVTDAIRRYEGRTGGAARTT
jgi:hypothetical protein